jgi:hypothetical protein
MAHSIKEWAISLDAFYRTNLLSSQIATMNSKGNTSVLDKNDSIFSLCRKYPLSNAGCRFSPVLTHDANNTKTTAAANEIFVLSRRIHEKDEAIHSNPIDATPNATI